jgi:segregation and condensation protein B
MEKAILKQILEGLLLASGTPVSLQKMASIFPDDERPEVKDLREALEELQQESENRGVVLQELASGYCYRVRKEISHYVGNLWEEKATRYSRALLETLAIIAYRQPITRSEIEQIRGVVVSTTIAKTLLEREWIRVVGHRDVPGKPALYATTRQFLDYFGLKSLDELPPLSEISNLESIDLPFLEAVPPVGAEDEELAEAAEVAQSAEVTEMEAGETETAEVAESTEVTELEAEETESTEVAELEAEETVETAEIAEVAETESAEEIM